MHQAHNNQAFTRYESETSERVRIYDRLGMEYEGRKTLAEVCEEVGLDREAALRALLAENGAAGEQTDETKESTRQLLTKLLAADHHLLQNELPGIAELISTLVRTQGYLYPNLWKVQDVFGRFKEGMESHIRREEEILQMRYPQAGPMAQSPHTPYGTLSDLLRGLEYEHRLAEEALAEICELTTGYMPPADAGARYKVLMQEMAELDTCVRQHIDAERQIFFPARA